MMALEEIEPLMVALINFLLTGHLMKNFYTFILSFFIILYASPFSFSAGNPHAVTDGVIQDEDATRISHSAAREEVDVEEIIISAPVARMDIEAAAAPDDLPEKYTDKYYEDLYAAMKADIEYELAREEEALGPDLNPVLRGVYEGDEIKGVDPKKKACLVAGAVTFALLTSSMYGNLVADNGGIGTLLGVDPLYSGYDRPYQTVILGLVLGASTFVGFLQKGLDIVEWMTQRSSIYNKVSLNSESSIRTVFALFFPVVLIELFPFYTFVDTTLQSNSADAAMQTLYYAYCVVAGIPWAITMLGSAAHQVNKQFRSCKRFDRKYKRKKRVEEKLRYRMLDRLSANIRKAIKDPDAAYDMWQKINAFRNHAKKESDRLGENIKDVELQIIKASDAANSSDDSSSDEESTAATERTAENLLETKNDVSYLEQRTARAILSRVFNLMNMKDPEEKKAYYIKKPFLKSSSGKKCLQACCDDQPAFNQVLRTLGVVVGGMAGVSLYYQAGEITKEVLYGYGNSSTLPLDNTTELYAAENVFFGAGLALGAYYTLYLANQARQAFSTFSNRLAGYDYTEKDYIGVNYKILRGFVSVGVFAQSILVMWPFSTVGGKGMEEGVGRWFPVVSPFEIQLTTHIPAMIVWGALEYNLLEGAYQKIISNLARSHSVNRLRTLHAEIPKQRKKQAQAGEEIRQITAKQDHVGAYEEDGVPIAGSAQNLMNTGYNAELVQALARETRARERIEEILEEQETLEKKDAQQKLVNLMVYVKGKIERLRGGVLTSLKQLWRKIPKLGRSTTASIAFSDEEPSDPYSTHPIGEGEEVEEEEDFVTDDFNYLSSSSSDDDD